MKKISRIKMIRNRLRILLAERDLTQKELMKRTGISSNTVSQMVNNKMQRYDITILKNLCDFFNVDLNELLIYEGR